jgi:UDP-N-acetylglucosamine 2-epimerase (non-hydrolysing)
MQGSLPQRELLTLSPQAVRTVGRRDEGMGARNVYTSRKAMKLLHVVGARPNFMKAAPVFRALQRQGTVHQIIVHTGQHYDYNMSDVFFEQLQMPLPDVNLQVGSGSHAQQTAEIMSRFERVALERQPDIIVVYGDVNSTVACALVASKLGIKVGHVEAGLRSFDRSMPEEINRVLTDQISDLLFTPSEDGNRNLLIEGIATEKIHLVGNVMIDTLVSMLPLTSEYLPPNLPSRFALLTLHRPVNVDDTEWLGQIFSTLEELNEEIAILFPAHPRTRQRLSEAGLRESKLKIRVLDPLPYLSFLALQQRATVVITDSGGIQEETTYLGTPCLTVRENTERPITIDLGTNVLVGRSPERLRSEVEKVLAGNRKDSRIPPLWDGNTATRIANILFAELGRHDKTSTETVLPVSR